MFKRIAENRFLDILLIAAALSILIIQLPQRAKQNDFAHYYVSSRLLIEGEHPYGVPLEPIMKEHGFGYLTEEISMASNPPVLLWIFAPLAWMPPTGAFWTWVAIEAICLVTLLWLTKKLIGDQMDEKNWRLFCSIVAISPAVYWHFHYSQVQLLLAVLVLSAFSSHRKGKHSVACLLVTIAGVIKLFPFILLPWFLWRGSRSRTEFAKHATMCLAVTVFGVLISGPSLWVGFFAEGRKVILDWAMLGGLNYTVPSFVFTTVRIISVALSYGGNIDSAWPFAVLAGLTLIGWAYWKCLSRPGNETVEFCLLCLVMLCGGATSWMHYQVFLIFPFAYASTQIAANPTRRKIIVFGTTIIMVFLHGNLAERANVHTFLAIYLTFLPLYGMLLFVWYFAGQIRPTSKTRNVKPTYEDRSVISTSASLTSA